MSRLVLVRHAKSDYPWGVTDHDRPLNERGRRDAPEIGRWLDEHLTWPEGRVPRVVVSTARRAQLTWGLASQSLSDRWAAVPVEDDGRIYEAPPSALLEVARERAADADTVVLVGHNPGLAQLVLMLASPSDLRAEATAKFPTSAVCVLSTDLPLADALATSVAFSVSGFAVPRG